MPCAYSAFAQDVRYDHMRMVFGKARIAFLAAGETLANLDELEQAQLLLEWMSNLLDQVPEEPKDNRTRCNDLLDMVAGLLSNIACGANFFGKDFTYAPRQSLTAYQTWLDKSLESLKAIEETQERYYLALKERTAQEDNLKNVLKSCEVQHKYYEQQLTETSNNITAAVDAIDHAEKVIAQARAALNATLVKFADAVKKHFQLPSIDQLIAIVETLSFTPHEGDPQKAAMIASQAAKVLSSAVGEVQGGNGVGYRKEYILQIDVFGRDVRTLQESYNIAADRRVTLKDAYAYQLLIQRDAFNRICDPFYKDPSVHADEARDAMNYFVEEVQNRNNAVLTYNNLLRLQEDLKARQATINLQRREAETARSNAAMPGLLAMRVYVADLYERAKIRCLCDLYRAVRAYVFWSLEDYTLFDQLLSGKHPGELTYAVLQDGRDTILEKLKDAQEKIARPPQSFQKVTVKLSAFPEAVTMLKANNFAQFSIPPVRRDTTKAQSPFAGLARVRVTKVRPWAIGLKTADHQHHIVITHLSARRWPGRRPGRKHSARKLAGPIPAAPTACSPAR